MEIEMEELEGYVENIVFRNEENGYTVLHLSHPEWDDEVCCVGCFSYVAEGQYLVIQGERVFHKEYGEQINPKILWRLRSILVPERLKG